MSFLLGRPAILGRAVILVLILAIASAAGQVGDSGHKKAKGAKKKKSLPLPGISPGQGEQSLTNIPLPIGQEAKGLVLPDFDLQGRLRGKFVAGSARRLDQDHIGFQNLKITTYNDASQPDLEIEMQTSTFDLTTKILKSDQRTTVRRTDFNVVGDSAIFDTNARTSTITGNVKMVITDQGQSHILEKPNP